MLDLSGSGNDVANRLVNVNAMHVMAAPNTSCAQVKYIDPTTPSASWLLAKINGTQGACGIQMPEIGGPLTDMQKACITDFVNSEAPGGAATTGGAGAAAGGAAATTTGGAAAGGAAATGTGGTATAGSGGM
jgi:hypothetical protein